MNFKRAGCEFSTQQDSGAKNLFSLAFAQNLHHLKALSGQGGIVGHRIARVEEGRTVLGIVDP